MNLALPFQFTAEAFRVVGPCLRLAILCLSAVAVLGEAPVRAQQLKGEVQQNEAPPTSGDVFNSQSPEFNSQGPGESFNSQTYFVDPQRCAADNARLAKKSNLPAGWGPPQLVSSATVTRYPSEYWAYYQNYACRPGTAIVYRNLNYGKQPPPGQTGWYPGFTSATNDPSKWTPPPDVPGGVKFCDNPNAWRYPQCQQQAVAAPTRPPLQGHISNTDDECTPPPNTQQQALKLAAQLAQMANNAVNDAFIANDQFLQAAATAIADNLLFLAQKPGEPVQQMRQALGQAVSQAGPVFIAYLANDNAANHLMLYQAAQRAAAQIGKNPAKFLGTAAGNTAFGAVQGAAGRVCQLGARKLVNLAKAEKAAENLLKIEATEQADALAYNEGRAAAAKASYGASTPKNACFAKNACWPIAKAQAELWRSGENYVVEGAQSLQKSDLTHELWEIIEELRGFKNGEAPHPGVGYVDYAPRLPGIFTPEELNAIWQGVPIEKSLQDIEKIVAKGGEGSQGFVFITFEPGTNPVPGEPLSHVLNVRFHGGKVEFVDRAITGMDPRFYFSLVTKSRYFPVE